MRKNDMIRTKALADYLGKKPGALGHAGTPINQVLHAPTSAFTDLGAFLRGSLALQAMEGTECRTLVFSSSATVHRDPASVPITEDFPRSDTNP
jgi:UDP-glucose 4-epimerase